MRDMSEEKLIVCSVVAGDAPLPVTGLIQAWSVDTLYDNLRRQRRVMSFVPVAAFTAQPDRFGELMGLRSFPADVWVGWMAANLSRARIEPAAQLPIFRHIALMGDVGVELLAAWAIAVGFKDVI